jgi:hypothetical protein
MRHAASRRHPVHRARLDGELGADGIAVHDGAGEEVGDGGQPDMRVRPHVQAIAEQELRRPHLVEEDERADHLLAPGGQGAPHLEAAEVGRLRQDGELDPGAAERIAGDRVRGRLERHALTSASARNVPRAAGLLKPEPAGQGGTG